MNDAKKFCTSCQFQKPADTGVMKQTRNSPRWVCKVCAERKSESIYRNHDHSIFAPRFRYAGLP